MIDLDSLHPSLNRAVPTTFFALVMFSLLGTVCMQGLFSKQVYADGLTSETLQPVLVRGKLLSLFIRISPPILTTETVGDASLHLRLFDTFNNQTVQHVTYFINASKQDEPATPLLVERFHSHSGPLTLDLNPKQGNVMVHGETDPSSGGWTATGDQLNVEGPLLLESGLYYFNIKILGMDDDTVSLESETAPVFQGWLSVGDSFETKLVVDNQEYDATIISYYERVQDYAFDSTQKRFTWSTPFDWNLERIANQTIFVHQEVKIPKSLVQSLNSSSFVATVNDVPLSTFAVAVDPYTSVNEMIVHFLINKPTIIELAQLRGQQSNHSYNNAMSFALTINSEKANPDQTSTELVSDTGAIKILLSWTPDQLVPDSESILNVRFYDAFAKRIGGETLVTGDTRYDLKLIDRSGNVFLLRENLIANNGADSQVITLPAEDVYDIQLSITGIRKSGSEEWDQTRNGTAFGVVVVPEFPIPVLVVASLLATIVVATRLSAVIRR